MYSEMADVTALEVAKKKMDNASGSMEHLKGIIETLQIRALRPTLPYIKKFADSMGHMVQNFAPSILNNVQFNVDRAANYIKTHFINNPEFNKLDKQGKIEFIINDFKKTFDKWYSSGGKEQIEQAAAALTYFLGMTVGQLTQPVTAAGLKLGNAIGQGMIDGLNDLIKEHPVLSGFGTAAVTPGTPMVKLVAANATMTAGNTMRSWEGYKKLFTTGELHESGKIFGETKFLDLKNLFNSEPVLSSLSEKKLKRKKQWFHGH